MPTPTTDGFWTRSRVNDVAAGSCINGIAAGSEADALAWGIVPVLANLIESRFITLRHAALVSCAASAFEQVLCAKAAPRVVQTRIEAVMAVCAYLFRLPEDGRKALVDRVDDENPLLKGLLDAVQSGATNPDEHFVIDRLRQ